MNRLLVAIGLFLCVSTLMGQPAQNPTAAAPIEVLLSKARAMEGRGRLDLAAQSWQQVLMANPNQAEALAGLARFATQSGNAAQAKMYTDRLRKIDPHHPALAQVESMKITGQQQARLQEAARLVRNQQMEQAVEIYREVFGDNPPPGGWAIAYYEALAATPGGWEPATAGLEKLMQKFPESGEYRLSLGTLQTYRPATRIEGMRLLESVQGNNLLMNKAKQAWRQALVWEGQNPAVLPSLRAYLTRYSDPELRKIESQLPHTEPAKGPVRTKDEIAGFAALEAGNVKEAEARFEAALKAAPKSVSALSGLGWVRMKQEDFAAAEGLFTTAKAEAPDDNVIADALEGSHFWGLMKSATKQLAAGREDSVAAFQEALRLRPASPEATQGLAGALMRFGKPEEAEPLFEKLLEQQPQNADLWRDTLDAKYQSGRAQAALAFSKQIPDAIQAQLAKTVEYHALMAAALSDAGHNSESKQHLQEGIDLANARNRDLPPPLQLQFAGLFLRHGYFAEAASVFREVTTLDPMNTNAWEGLLTSLVQNHQESAARRSVERMPKPAYEAALRHPTFLRSLSSIEMSFDKLDSAEAFLQRSIDLEGAVETRDNVAARLQLAQIWLRKGEPERAEKLLRSLQESQSDNPDYWKSLISVLHRQERDEEVISESARIPQNVRLALNSDVDYTNLMVSALTRLGDLDEALRLARREASLLKQQLRPVPADLQIQTAWLLLNTQADERELYFILARTGAQTDLTKEQEQQVREIWTVWALRRSDAATNAGDLERSIGILEAAVKVLPSNPKLESALAGNLLKAGQNKRALDVYLHWGMRGANAADYTGAIGAAMSQKEKKTAAEWLAQALQQWPKNGELLTLAGKQAADAGDYKRAEGYWKAAVGALKREEVAGRPAQPAKAPQPQAETDPLRALGEALLQDSSPAQPALGKPQPADAPLSSPNAEPASRPDHVLPVPRPINGPATGNPDWPDVAGSRPPSDRVRPMAMRVSDPQPGARAPQVSDPGVTLAQWELNPAPQAKPIDSLAQQPVTPGSTAPVQSRPGSSGSVLPGLDAPGLTSPVPTWQPPSAPSAPSAPAGKVLPPIPELLPDSPAPKTTRSPLQEVQDELDAVEARNTPSFTTGGTISGRSGDAGFDRLLVQQAEFEASSVIGESIRLSVIARPTYLDSGIPDGLSTERFGLLPSGATFTSQAVGGVGGEVQLATSTFGMRLGSTPREFLVPNLLGGIRFRPGNGPITLLAERDTVKDSLLSYAGARDPITNRVWGGVVANTVSMVANFGTEVSGFYASAGVQYLTGTGVEDNTRVDGNTGAYWRLLHFDQGSLTAGFNISAMHYDKNLRFYSLGQGGYFSPQRYLLFNVPVQWKGSYKGKLQYVVSGSLGSQHFEEDTSPVFPTLPALEGPAGQYYPRQAVTGANYSLDVRLVYQVAPHWILGAWVNMNNSRNYNSQTAGIYVTYSLKERPPFTADIAPSIPDWRGTQLFTVR